MKVKNYLWTLAAALTLVGCSDDLETQKGGPEEGTEQAKGEYYLYFSLDTPETKASDNQVVKKVTVTKLVRMRKTM